MKPLLDRYVRHLRDERNLSPNTVAAYERDLRQFCRFLDEYLGGTGWRWEDVDRLTIRSFLGSLEARRLKRSTGSIGNMSPDNAFIKALAPLPIAPGVHAHSIIGVRKGPKEDGGDGVVSYRSAHLDDVESELVVRSGHSSQCNAAVVREVHRILLEHLKKAIENGIVEAVDFSFDE